MLADYGSEGLRNYYYDALGSAVYVSFWGTVYNGVAYGAWGDVVDSLNTPDTPDQFVGQLGYYTHNSSAQGSALGSLMQLGVRFYDVGIGRFTQRDAVDAAEGYAYAGCSPLVWIDTDGNRKTKPKKPKQPTYEEPGFAGGWALIDEAIQMSDCKDVLNHISTDKFRSIVRCIIWGESSPSHRDSMKYSTHAPYYGIFQLKDPHGAGTECNADYPNWKTDTRQNVFCGVRALCRRLKDAKYDMGAKCVHALYDFVDNDSYKSCMKGLGY